jgi:hypothetical protein
VEVNEQETALGMQRFLGVRQDETLVEVMHEIATGLVPALLPSVANIHLWKIYCSN